MSKAIKNGVKSWKTTLAGLIGMLLIVGKESLALLDASDVTSPNWNLVFAAIMAFITALLARDNDKSSESVGASEPSATVTVSEPGLIEP